MKRICIAISSNDKDTTMHLEIYAPEYKGDLKGLIQICHGMTEYMGRYVEFAKYFTSRGYIVFGNDIISHGHSTTPRSSCLYINDWNDTVKDMVSAREYVVRKYPNLPIYLLGFSLGSFIVRTNADLTPYKKEILIGTGAQSAFLMRIMRTWIGKKYTGKMSCASDKIYDLMFGTYGKKFKGRPANYWLLTDNEKRREYADDSLVRQDVSPAFFCEFSKGMECASRNLKIRIIPFQLYSCMEKKIRYPVLEKASERYIKHTKKTTRIRRSEAFPELTISCMTPDMNRYLRQSPII